MSIERCRRVRLTHGALRCSVRKKCTVEISTTWDPGGRSWRACSRDVGRVQRDAALAQRASSRCRAGSTMSRFWQAPAESQIARVGVPDTEAVLRGQGCARSRAASVPAQRLQLALNQMHLHSRRWRTKWPFQAFCGGSRGGSRIASPACSAVARMWPDPLGRMSGRCWRVTLRDLRAYVGRAT